MIKSSLFFGRTGDILIRLFIAFIASFLLFVLFALLHSIVGHKLTSAISEKVKKPVQAEMVRKQLPKKKEFAQQTRQVKSSSSGKDGASKSAPSFRFAPDLTSAAGNGNGAVLEGGSVQAEVFKEGETDEPAILLSASPIEYPDRLRELGIEGILEVLIVVDVNGSVSRIEIIRSPHPIIEKNAKEIIAKWKFKPAKNRGIPVSVKMRQLVEFNLNR